MLLKATISQTALLLKKKEAVCVFYILLTMVIINFIGNVLCFQGMDVLEMYHPMKILLLSYNRTYLNASNTLLLIQLYPILVVAVGGFSLAKEYQLGIKVYMVSRIGNNAYQFSKLMSVFLASMIVFTVPFLLEIILNCLSFPLSATGDLSNMSLYDSDYVKNINHYFMKSIYLYSPYLYGVLGTFIFGIISGIFGVFTALISLLIKVKYNVFLFLPVFVLLNYSAALEEGVLVGGGSRRWYNYLLLFNEEPKSVLFIVMTISIFIIFSIVVIGVDRRKDCI